MVDTTGSVPMCTRSSHPFHIRSTGDATMRGSLVVLALAVTSLVPRVSGAQVRSHAVRHVSPIAHRDDDKNHGKNDKNDDKKCERGNPSQNGRDHRRADPPGMKDCNVSQQGGQTPPPPPPPPAPSPDPAPTP